MHFVSPGPGKLSVSVENPDGSQTDVLVTDNGNGNFTITWTAEMVGKHKVVVKFGGKPVPGSPFAVSALMKVSTNLLRCNIREHCYKVMALCALFP